MASRPVLAISYLPKTEYIMRVLRLDHHVVDIAQFDIPRVCAMIDTMLADPVKASAEVREAVTVYRREQRQLKDVLKIIL